MNAGWIAEPTLAPGPITNPCWFAPGPSPLWGVSLESRGPFGAASMVAYTANVGCGRMVSQSPPTIVHFQLVASAPAQGAASMAGSELGLGNGVITMGAVGQLGRLPPLSAPGMPAPPSAPPLPLAPAPPSRL